MKRCPVCDKEIRATEEKCPYCNATQTNKSIDRRNYPRYKYTDFIKYKNLANSASGWLDAKSANIGLGGIKFITDKKLAVKNNVLIRLELFISIGEPEIIELSAKVVGVKEILNGYETRISFDRLGTVTKNKFKDFLKSFDRD